MPEDSTIPDPVEVVRATFEAQRLPATGDRHIRDGKVTRLVLYGDRDRVPPTSA